MPIVRKLSPEEVAKIVGASGPPSYQRPLVLPSGNLRDPFFDHVDARADAAPRLGDIVYYRFGPVVRKGIITYVWWHHLAWRGVELFDEGVLRIVAAPQIGRKLGRPPGISRIDQAERRTHGWFVRIYRDGKNCVSRMFSDGKYGGPGAALRMAVAFQRQPDYRPARYETRKRSTGGT
ncbi:MAG TPA: hypothetical protein VFT99_14670 [Roseiflexaceae bacterium]|nr:hypothetical protein [Roseiflexaceae bacterium]